MLYRRTRSVFTAVLFVLVALLAAPVIGKAQTFRGGINGAVTDASGAVVSGAIVDATDTATGVSHKTVSSSAGEYSFQDLPLGAYKVTVNASGFKAEVVSGVQVQAGVIYTLPVKLSIQAAGETVEVSASELTLDTTSTTQVAEVGGQELQDTPLNGRDFTQLIILTPGFSNSGAGGYGSLNGTRANQINWQIDGIDNNDLWHNIPAVNQGGVSGIAGIVLPIDAVEQFSAQTQASAGIGPQSWWEREPLAQVGRQRAAWFGLLLQSQRGLRRHQSVHRAGQAGSAQLQLRFLRQRSFHARTIFSGSRPTSTSASRSASRKPLPSQMCLGKRLPWPRSPTSGCSPSTVTQSLLKTLWPADAVGGGTGAPALNNFVSSTPEFGYSYNGLAKIDYTINDKNSLTAHWFVGQGNQVAPVGSSLPWYYEVAPIHVQNYAIVYNHVFSPTITNQVLAGVNYFNQVFNDENTAFDVSLSRACRPAPVFLVRRKYQHHGASIPSARRRRKAATISPATSPMTFRG